MDNRLKTLNLIPDTDGRRFASTTFGSDQTTTIRREFVLLRQLAAAVCGCEPEALTPDDVQRCIDKLAERRALSTDRQMKGTFRSIESLTSLMRLNEDTRHESTDAALWILAFGRGSH